jgi:hypothetical protein
MGRDLGLPLQKLDYVSPPTTREDTGRRRGNVLLLLGYLPAALLFAFMICCLVAIFGLAIAGR